MRQPCVVYTDISDIDPAPGIALLKERGIQVTVLDEATSDGDRLAVYEGADAIVVGYRVLDAALLDRLPRLGMIATLSVGYDMVDVEHASRLGIRVAAVPAHATQEVAAHALALALAVERNLVVATDGVRRGGWDARAFGAPRRLSDSTLGIVGLGRIGGELARIAAPLFAEVIAHDPAGGSTSDVRMVDLDELLSQAHVVSLHTPLAESTRHLIDRSALSRMRTGATIVNVSRGALIDTDALVDALRSGHIHGVGLDVTDPEPLPVTHELRSMASVVLTPHVAFASTATIRAYAESPSRAILAWMDGEVSAATVSSCIAERSWASLVS